MTLEDCYIIDFNSCPHDGMVDIADLKSAGRKPLPVQVWLRVPFFIILQSLYSLIFSDLTTLGSLIMLIRTENTPNPQAIKFLPSMEVAGENSIYFTDKQVAYQKSTLAFNLLNLPGVQAVFFGSDFITITKSEDIDWQVIKPEILVTMMDHFNMELPIFNDINSLNGDSLKSSDEFSEIERQIIEIIDTRVRPSVAMDGGDIIYRGFENGIVMLEMHGSCAGCPSSSITLKNGIESMLKHFIPEVIAVESVN